MIPNKVQLITYADSLGGDLKKLDAVLDEYFPGVFGAIHILPPFPSSGDRGFAPLSYFEIEPSFGIWEDMAALGKKYPLLLDVMVNHISRSSNQFQDFLKKGRASKYAGFFLTMDKLWPGGKPKLEDIKKVYLRRPVPYSTYTLADGSIENVWTTFGNTDPSEQIDLDVSAPEVREWFQEIFAFFARNGISMVRLDAVGYVIKKMGTSCFLTDPEFYEFLDWIKTTAANAGITLLCEVHAETAIQKKLSDAGYWILNFSQNYTYNRNSLSYKELSSFGVGIIFSPTNCLNLL
ncbi:MAG: hypothetical protein LBQ88_05125 [Treponema sp.]|jgi:sucrose phosphorylase|nr:hypothetical protein [Treponema sp.]